MANSLTPLGWQCPQENDVWTPENHQWRSDDHQVVVLRHRRRKKNCAQAVERRKQRGDEREPACEKGDRLPSPLARRRTPEADRVENRREREKRDRDRLEGPRQSHACRNRSGTAIAMIESANIALIAIPAIAMNRTRGVSSIHPLQAQNAPNAAMSNAISVTSHMIHSAWLRQTYCTSAKRSCRSIAHAIGAVRIPLQSATFLCVASMAECK